MGRRKARGLRDAHGVLVGLNPKFLRRDETEGFGAVHGGLPDNR